MDQQRYYDRKQYVQQARESFAEGRDKRNRDHYVREQEEAEHLPKSYFRLRLVLAAALFAAFFLLWLTGWNYQDISAETIQEKIQAGIEIPESFPQLPDLTSVIKSEK